MSLGDRKAFPQIELRDRTPDKSWTHIEGGLTVRQYVATECVKTIINKLPIPPDKADALMVATTANKFADALIASWEVK